MKTFCCITLLIIYFNISAQHRSLQPGDTLPANVLASITAYQQPETSNQLLILDFMSVSCISCLQALPKIDALQQRYGFSVLIVTPDKNEKLAAFQKRRPLPFPVMAEDSLLKSYFPHQFISHIVWIYKNRVVAVTRSDYITAANIETLLAGRPFSLPVKQDRIDYDYTQSLLPPAADTEAFRSVLLSNIEGVPRRFRQGIDTIAGRRWFRFINYPIIDIYCKAYRLPLQWPRRQLQLSVTDTTRFIFDKQIHFRQQWNNDNTFCYEAAFPLGAAEDSCWQTIRTDLDTRFRLRTALQQNPAPLLLITELTGSQTPASNLK